MSHTIVLIQDEVFPALGLNIFVAKYILLLNSLLSSHLLYFFHLMLLLILLLLQVIHNCGLWSKILKR